MASSIRFTGTGTVTLEGAWQVEGLPEQPPTEPPPDTGGDIPANPNAPPPPPQPAVQPGSSGKVHTVGEKGLRTVAETIAAASDGDTVIVPPGTARESFVIYKALLVDGTGVQWDFSDVPAGNLIYQGKAAIVANVNGWVVRGFTISGAGIRETQSTMVAAIRCDTAGYGLVENCTLTNNQTGVAADNGPMWDVTIRGCTIAGNGIGDGYSHNIYMGDGYAVRLEDTDSTDPNVGYALKTRCFYTIVTGGTLQSRTASCIDLANGGLLVVKSAELSKPANSSNKRFISYGLEYQNCGLLDSNVVEDSTIALECPDPFIQMAGGTITFAASCEWRGNVPAVNGGTVVGLPSGKRSK